MADKRSVKSVEVGDNGGSDGPAILVASNGTARGACAFEAAARLAEIKNGWVITERIFDFPEGGGDSADALERVAAEARELFKGQGRCLVEVDKLSESYTDENYGRAMMLADAATRHDAKLIVIGVHGQKKSANALSATMTQKLMKVAPCPVLIVSRHDSGDYRKVMVAVDFSDCSLTCIKEAMRFAPQAEYDLVHVGDDAAAAESELRQLVAQARDALQGQLETVPGEDAFRVEIGQGKPTDVIADAAAEHRPDLMVMGTRGRSGLAKLVLGSVASRFIAAPPCDLLVLRNR
ncbi:MAG: universal stress protein [Pseudomonadota bacterium]